MSFNNFSPTVWSESILAEREKTLVAVKLCNRDYEGEIRNYGDKVKINGVSRPTISTYDPSMGLSTPEVLPVQSTLLEINQAKSFNFMVGDIDKRQSKGDISDNEIREAANAVAQLQDSYVYEQCVSEAGKIITVDSLAASDIFSTITDALAYLYNNNVPTSERISIEVSPEFANKMLLGNILRNTNNTNAIEGGFLETVRMFNADAYLTTNLHKTAEGYHDIVVRSKKAVSFAGQISQVEAYRPEKYFADAIRGLDLYGAKVIRPKEIVIIRVKAYATETSI